MTTSPLSLHTFATCESGAGSFVVRLGFETLAHAQTALQYVVDSARAKPDTVPAWFDSKALEVARRFTQDVEPQRRASLQVAVVEAMQMAGKPEREPEPWPPMGVCWAISDVRSTYRGDMGAQRALDLLEVRIMNAKPKASTLRPTDYATPALAFAARVTEVFKETHGEAPDDTMSSMRHAVTTAFSELPTAASPTPPAAQGDAAEICERIALKHQKTEGTYAAGKKAGALECAEAIRSATPTAAGDEAKPTGVAALGNAIERALDEAPVSDVLSIITGTFVGLTVELVRRKGHDTSKPITVDGGQERDITIHAPKAEAGKVGG